MDLNKFVISILEKIKKRYILFYFFRKHAKIIYLTSVWILIIK